MTTTPRHKWLNVDGPDHRQCQECGIECHVGYNHDNRRTVTWTRDGATIAVGAKTPPCESQSTAEPVTTTPRIPAEAVQAAAEALFRDNETSAEYHGPDWTWREFEGTARLALAAALPLLGKVTTEYTIRVTRDGSTHTLDDNTTLDRDRAERGAAKLRGYKTGTNVVARTVITGPWTEEE